MLQTYCAAPFPYRAVGELLTHPAVKEAVKEGEALASRLLLVPGIEAAGERATADCSVLVREAESRRMPWGTADGHH